MPASVRPVALFPNTLRSTIDLDQALRGTECETRFIAQNNDKGLHMSAPTATPHLACEFDPELIRRLDRNGPRYTSYPTADRFVDSFGPADYIASVMQRNTGAVRRGLSLYVHLPFCSTLCFYCACNKIATRDRNKAARYLDYLYREIDMKSALFTQGRRVEQMHWGGGTPTFYAIDDLTRLFETLRRKFDFAEDGEYSIEIDPRTVDAAGVAALRKMGFNRISLGVQDFDEDVQRAVNRIQSETETLAVMQAARAEGVQSINVDLIYGLPKQNLITFNRTLARVIAANPDRIAIYNYAHLPERFMPQRRIADADLPTADTKLKLLGLATQRLAESGYVFIGMDHFARADDSLAVAQREGRLHRNFQGYSTHAECDLVGLGVSSIGQVGPTYSQNYRELEHYYASLDRGRLPIARGMVLTADDLARRAVIQHLMCDFTLSMQNIETSYLINFKEYFSEELRELEPLEQAGLVQLEPDWIQVTAKGRMLVRNVCMVFDAYLRQAQSTTRFSRVI
jgi:oxygen-independent coproporphyrinogen-3 oxidase